LLIAIFDSGIGGITVLKKALEFSLDAEYIYYADTENVPYGVKKGHEVIDYVLRAFDFLSKKNIQIAVIACNTATSVAVSELRKKYTFPIIGMEPAIKPAILNNSGKKILVLATSLTLEERKFEELICSLDKQQRIHKLALDELVLYAEQFNFNSEAVIHYLQEKLSNIDFAQYETIVLGCTHFVYYSKIIQDIAGKNISIIDGNEGTVINMIRKMKGMPLNPGSSHKKGRITFYSSGVEDSLDRVNKLLGILELNKRVY
jgi:glutamate racemase